MLGGMSGGGMGFFVDPSVKQEALTEIQEIMRSAKQDLEKSLPFAMDPVVYEFTINANGTYGELLAGEEALLPPIYYKQVIPNLVKEDIKNMPSDRLAELQAFTRSCDQNAQFQQAIPQFFKQLLPDTESKRITGVTWTSYSRRTDSIPSNMRRFANT